MPEFLWYALAAGLLVAVAAGPLGAFIVWQRMSFFGDTLAHSALLGVAMGLLVGSGTDIAVPVSCMAVAAALVVLHEHTGLAQDNLLAIIAHSALALGLVFISLSERGNSDVSAYLFGDILAVTPVDLATIGLSVTACVVVLLRQWNPLLAVTVHPELAAIDGLPVRRLRLTLALLVAVVVASAMKVVGVLLVTALLIIPASAAIRLARSPEAMAMAGSGLAATAVVAGLALSWFADTPAGPSMVVASTALFTITQVVSRSWQR